MPGTRPARDALSIRQLDSIAAVTELQWESLERRDNPFLSWRFLNNLENNVNLEKHGWRPCHLTACDGAILLAAIPLYAKENSHGEFVFDWMIADAYHHAGLPYYPKFVSAIPFTPVIGDRLLYSRDLSRRDAVADAMLAALMDRCAAAQSSCLNFLFCSTADQAALARNGFVQRHTWQYHWRNQAYADFDDFLSRLTSRRRKQIRRERKSIAEQNIDITILEGDQISADHWRVFYDFYCSTFERKWGEPRFTLEFFQALSRDMPQAVTLFLATRYKRYVAGSFTMKSATAMYGRHWGCNAWHANLHFELCYYQTIEYCIRERLDTLDAGVQGEHKLLRGFMPVRTTSMHWYQRPEFMQAIERYYDQETRQVNTQIAALARHNAYNSTINNELSNDEPES